jgi:hypothetical protein
MASDEYEGLAHSLEASNSPITLSELLEFDALGTLLRCPVCVETEEAIPVGVHLVGVEVDAGGTVTKVRQNGTTVRAGDHECVERGSVVSIDCGCENGHHFFIQFAFHKGQTSAVARVLPDTGEWPADIWRD